MTTNNASNTYLSSKVMTASSQELTLMLYDGALKFCNQAIRALENQKTVEAHNFIIKTENIIIEFMSTVDTKYDVGKNLDAMYNYIYRKLMEANTKKDKQILEEVQGYLRELRDTWKEAMEMSKVKKAVNE
ncbi:MAG TPA: flagellar export chaperone FliS [Clostridiales bacterium]|nr:MAG: flagellar export chaperone FliS [Clostridiales bacterium GWD2_32_59]HAN10729.1 flagellar export chaperone FliS [Clostridiales bacterium]